MKLALYVSMVDELKLDKTFDKLSVDTSGFELLPIYYREFSAQAIALCESSDLMKLGTKTPNPTPFKE